MVSVNSQPTFVFQSSYIGVSAKLHIGIHSWLAPYPFLCLFFFFFLPALKAYPFLVLPCSFFTEKLMLLCILFHSIPEELVPSEKGQLP